MHLSDLWFIAIAVLWAGYFVLEGFDFGVGILLPVLGRDHRERRVMINTIGATAGRTVLLITHRPVHPADVDQVVRLDDGRVVSR